MDYSQVSQHSALRRWPESRTDSEESIYSRPKSRRGTHNISTHNTSQSIERKSSKMRPGSAYRGGTASRLPTGNVGAPPPTAIGRIGTANFGNFDRPITQQGLSGMRTGTGMTRQRQLRDRRYWEEILSGRVRALKTEVTRLQKLADTAARERSANKHYEARGRELAQELTDLQGRLSDYNVASQMLTASDTIAIQKQTNELEVSNNQLSTELENVFAERQHKEDALKQLTEQINKEKNAMDILIKEMSQPEQLQYTQLNNLVTNLQEETEQARTQIEEMTKVKNDLEKQISMSQMKIHMVDLLRKLMLVEEKRESLKDEMNNKLQPAQERDQLLIQVREDNGAISSMENSIQSIKEEIKKVQDQLEQAEQDLEEGQSERHKKYRELKKREETMDGFMSTYEINMKEEKNRVKNLESDIVFSLEHMSSNIDQLNFDEIDSLKLKNGTHNSLEVDSNKTVDALIKDYERQKAQLKKANSTRENLSSEIINLPEKIKALQQSIETVSKLDTLKTEGSNRKRELNNEADELREKLIPTDNAVKEATNKYHKLQKNLDGNEMYAQLNAMEEKLLEIENSNTALREDIASITIKTDYEPLKNQVFDVVKELNERLTSGSKSHLY